MSYLRLEDQADGIHIFFDDVPGVTNPSDWVETDVATISRASHTIKLTMDALGGSSNDIVKVYVDGLLVKTGTSWENYYRNDSEAAAEQSPRIVKTLLIRAGGTAVPANAGYGFLFDNISLSSSEVPAVVSSGNIADLQSAINAASSGGTVQVTGSYTGNLTISQPITLEAASGTTPSLTGSITIASDNVTVGGLDIMNPDAANGIVINGKSNVSIAGNTIHDIGTSLMSGSAQAIYLSGGTSISISDVSFTNNVITNIGSSNLAYSGVSGSGTSAKGIYVGDTSGTGTITGLTISNNNISNVLASTTPWTSAPAPVTKYGRGAYGVLVNFGGTTSGAISNNIIGNLSGFWAHAIGLERNTPSMTVSNNTVTNLTNNGSDSSALRLEDNPSGSTVTGTGNTLDSKPMVLGGASVFVDPSVSGFTSATHPEVLLNGSYYYAGINAFSKVLDAVNAVQPGGVIKVRPGDYNLVKDDVTMISGQAGWYLPITKNNITIEGVTADGQGITNASNVMANLYSTQETANGNWSTQDLIAVFGDDVTIRGLGIMNKIEPNKGIEVLGNNFRAEYNRFAPVPKSLFVNADNYGGDDITKFGSGVYFNNNSATAARTGTVVNNIFNNSGVTFDSFGNNWTINVSNNVFDGNRIWTSGGVDYYYSSVGATTWANQPNFTGSTINISGNQFVNMVSGQPLLKFKAGMTGAFNAASNWWGSGAGPSIGSIVGDNITTTPWYMDALMTMLNTGTPSVTGDEASTTLPVAITQTGSDGGVTVTAEIPAGTVITGDSSWDGVISAPVATTDPVVTVEEGYSATITSAISIGSSDSDLTFDTAVKLTFAGEVGKRVGWVNHAGVFTEITDVCAANDQAAGNALAAGTSCKIDASPDLVVWTKHFSTFTTYSSSIATPVINPNGAVFHGSVNVTMDNSTPPATIRYTVDGSDPICGGGLGYANGQVLTFSGPVTLKAIRCDGVSNSAIATAAFSPAGGSGGGGGGGAIPATPATPATPTVAPATPATPAVPAEGRVLGATAFNFTKALFVGVRSDEVTELQKVLIAEGILKIDAPTGYFGQLTRTAVIAFQKARGIAGTGFVGPLTRTELNKGSVVSEVAKTNLTTAQADAILSTLASFGADAEVVAKVRAALGR